MSTVRALRPHLNKHCVIRNDYGPAECTLAATSYTITGNEHSNITSLPIERPLANSRVYLLDDYLQLAIPGHMAEIVIGGKNFSLLIARIVHIL
jgi:non-ribosomal peptide synthetase component F